MEVQRVGVTGTGAICASGRNVKEIADSLEKGISGIKYDERAEKHNFKSVVSGRSVDEKIFRLPNGDQELSDSDWKNSTSGQRFNLNAVAQAYEDSGGQINLADYNKSAPDVREHQAHFTSVGMGSGDYIWHQMIPHIEKAQEAKPGKGCRKMSTKNVGNSMNSSITWLSSKHLAPGGGVHCGSAACASGMQAIGEAYFKLRRREPDDLVTQIIAGGTEGNDLVIHAAFTGLKKVLSDYNYTDDNSRVIAAHHGSRPIMANPAGFVVGDGSGQLLLEDWGCAQKEGRDISVEILGYEHNSCGFRNGATETAGSDKGLVRCIKTALHKARVNPEEVGYISIHDAGTGFILKEFKAICIALGIKDIADLPFINALKYYYGHTLAAAGGISQALVIEQTKRGIIFGNPNVDEVHPGVYKLLEEEGIRNSSKLDDKIPRQTIEYPKGMVGLNLAFGFFGVNGVVVTKENDGTTNSTRHIQ